MKQCKGEGSSLSDFKFEFQRILLEYEYFVSLNLPKPFTNRLPKSAKLMSFFEKRHFLATVIVSDISRYLQEDNKSTRIKVSKSITLPK